MNTTSGKGGRAQDALAPVIDQIRSQLEASMGTFLDRAQKSLNDAWPGIPEFRKQDQIRYSASWLHTNKPRILSALHLRLISALSAVPEENKIPEDLGELRLMDADTLSAHLIRSRMVSRVMERGRNDLAALEMRFEDLQRRGGTVNGRALNPGALADGFLNALKDLQVPTDVQAVLLDVYGDQGVQLLVEFYQHVNQLLIDRGVLPELKIAPRVAFHRPSSSATSASSASSAPSTSSTGFDPGAGAEPPPLPDARAQVVQQLLEQVSRGEWQPGLFRQLLEWQFAQSGGGDGAAMTGGAMPLPPAGMPMAPGGVATATPAHAATQAIASSLAVGGDRAGVQVPGIPVAVTVDAIRDLAGLLSPMIFVDPHALSREQNKAIDKLESQSFELLRDERISPRVRSELSRLIPALLSAQLSFPGTFGAPDNPPRVFVRQLALLGYRDHEFPLADFDAVRVVVDRILAEEGREVESFRSGADVLYTLARQEVKRRIAAAAEERAKKAALAASSQAPTTPTPEAEPAAPANPEDLARHERDAFIAESRHQVALELSDRAAGIELTPPAAEFIKQVIGPWMMSRYQKYGADSQQWKDARAFATRFFEAIQPASDDAEQLHKEALRRRVLLEARLHSQRTVPVAQGDQLIANLERHLLSLGIVPLEQRLKSAGRTTPIDFLRELPRALA
ncbi:MAG TPA: DUF1631 family protein [Nevskiaceae bacterium]|nr:DUF1631 family protein [Nevskiaceae bacterium]